MRKIKVSSGLYWIEIPEAKVYIQCGCPANSVKHLKKKGLITSEEKASNVLSETGPNVILLSDLSIQQETFANLSEFTILQMLYRQGMMIPNHPNNTGELPILLGTENELRAQIEYIHRGNYGLISLDEIMSAGINRDEAEEMMKLKLRFAFGKIKETEELLETRIITSVPVEIKNDVFIHRKALNKFVISYLDGDLEVDLNLAPGEQYEAPYQLEFHHTKRDYFSVIHNGEGDGWDENRPCMASIITFQGKIYLIDAGPNIIESLRSLGIGINEIEGVFHTHAHDDHFNGLANLIRSDHRIKYYSSKLVRISVMKKLSALVSMDESTLEKYFEIHDLEVNVWNNIEGLEVKPVYGPHPVETNILFFRTLWEDGYQTYAHLADLTSLKLLKKMITSDPNTNGISQVYYDRIKNVYLTETHLKKIDIGGGMIHGDAVDFKRDKSSKILLSHTSKSLNGMQKEIGENTTFGAVDVLIPATSDYSMKQVSEYLKRYLPSVPEHEINMLLNCPVVSFNPGSILMKIGDKNKNIYIQLSGIMEFINYERGISNKLTVGSMAGELACLLDTTVKGTFRAISYVDVLVVPCALYLELLKRNHILEPLTNNATIRTFLQSTKLFGERISFTQKNLISKEVTVKVFEQDAQIDLSDCSKLYLVHEGEVALFSEDSYLETVRIGGFFGEACILEEEQINFKGVAETYTELFCIPKKLFVHIPIIEFKLIETYDRRKLILQLKKESQ